jgi:PleD family two-component response regulator
MVSFARALRRHPRHAGLCVIHVANGVSELPGLVRQGARDFILRAHLVNDLSPKAQLAIRRARLLRAMQRFLRACDGEGVHDEASGAFSSTFLSEHGARLCARADQTGRSFALSLICLFPDGAPGAAFGRVALHEAARLIRRVIRAEDLVARIGPEKFVALHPATGLRDAEMAARRICGVLAHASYKSDDGANVLAAGVQTTVLSRAPEASIEESVAALLRASNSGNARKVSGV